MVGNNLLHNHLLGYSGNVCGKIFESSAIISHHVKMQHGVTKQQKIMNLK